MSKPALGTKRVCRSCGARFYDLNRTPITCPVCQSMYQVSPPPSRRGAERAQPIERKKVVEAEAEAPVVESAEVISLEEAEEGAAEVPIEDEEIVDLGDDAAEIPAGDDENAFLEEEEEGEADVSSIVGGTSVKES